MNIEKMGYKKTIEIANDIFFNPSDFCYIDKNGVTTDFLGNEQLECYQHKTQNNSFFYDFIIFQNQVIHGILQ